MGGRGSGGAGVCKVGRIRLIVTGAAVSVAMVTVPPAALSVAAGAQAGPAHGTVTKVRAAFNFWAVACPPAGACVAVGQTERNEGMALPVRNGTVGKPDPVPGTLGLGGIACPMPNECLATGQSTSDTGVLVRIVGGRPTHLVQLPGTYLYAIACGTPRSCWVTGESTDLRHAVVVHVVDFKVERIYPLKGIYAGAFFGPDGNRPGVGTAYGPVPYCRTATSCVAVGATADYYGKHPGAGLVVSLADGRLTGARTVPGTAQLLGVVCPSATTCLADAAVKSTFAAGRLVGLTNGRAGHLVSTSLNGKYVGQLTGLACVSATTCYVMSEGGYVAPSVVTVSPTPVPAVDAITAVGGNSPGHEVFQGGFDQVSCNSTSCLAAGGDYDPSLPEHALGALLYFRT